MAAAGISAAQGAALFAIERSPGLSQREVAKTLKQQESAVTTMVSRLLAAELITRTPRKEDSRPLSLDLTDKGREALVRLRAERDKINRGIADALSTDELQVLAPALERRAEDRRLIQRPAGALSGDGPAQDFHHLGRSHRFRGRHNV